MQLPIFFSCGSARSRVEISDRAAFPGDDEPATLLDIACDPFHHLNDLSVWHCLCYPHLFTNRNVSRGNFLAHLNVCECVLAAELSATASHRGDRCHRSDRDMHSRN